MNDVMDSLRRNNVWRCFLFTIETIGIPKVFLKIAACSFHKFDGIIDIIYKNTYYIYIHAPLLHDTCFFYIRHIFGLELLEVDTNLTLHELQSRK